MREVERWNDPAAEFLTVSLFPLRTSHLMSEWIWEADLSRLGKRRKAQGGQSTKKHILKTVSTSRPGSDGTELVSRVSRHVAYHRSVLAR